MRFGVFVFVVVLACSSKDDVALPTVSGYFPLRTGAYFMYAVDSVVTEQTVQTAYSYELKIQAIDSFANGEGGFTFVIQRSKRATATSPWTAMNSWSARVNAYQLVVNEGNIAYVKLIGPLANGSIWDGNSLNNLGGSDKCPNSDTNTCDTYMLQALGQRYNIAQGASFPSSLTVVEANNGDLIVFQDKRSEVYAAGVGLVYREIIQLQYCTDNSCLGQQQVTHGLTYHQTLESYGGL